MSVTASLFMTACSQDEPDPNGGNGDDISDGNTSYMAVNLISSDSNGSRAASGYEDGSPEENKVNSVRFYFFNAAGGIVNVKLLNGSYVNYYDWTPGDVGNDTNDADDIEKKLPITIVINTKQGDKLPQMMAAVLNPSSEFKDNSETKGSLSLSKLREISRDYATSTLTEEGSFVMFNSVYANTGAEVCAVPITSDNLQKTPELAQKPENAVKIYVERSVAKVKVELSDAIGFVDGKLKLKDKDNKDLTVGGEQVYLQINGWSLTADTDKGRLVKKINPKWEGTWWNSTYRSCWAINEPTATNRYHSYNDIPNSLPAHLYTNENAQLKDIDGQGSTQTHTKVILKGTLCKANGEPFTIVRHLGSHFADTYSETPSENLPELKKNILSQLTANGYTYYYETTEGGKTVRKSIDTDDLKIVVADQESNEDSQNNCYVYAQLTDAANGKTWYNSLADTATPIEASVINSTLKDRKPGSTGSNGEEGDYIIDRALVWKSGMTYYYYEIKHLQNQTGVVRNHVYKTKVTKIAGLGTPVYDPTKNIYPEKPDPNDHYIAAVINILSWHIVSDEYALEW